MLKGEILEYKEKHLPIKFEQKLLSQQLHQKQEFEIADESKFPKEKYKPTAIVILGAAPSEGARRLYESVGFVNVGAAHYWAKLVD